MVSELQQLLHDSLLNNSYDYDAMKDQLKSSWMHSFSWLYALQHSHVEYAELFYYSNDTIGHDQSIIGTMYLDNLIRACFDVEYDMVKICKRELYYKSEFYNKEIKFSDIVENPDIFLKLPIVIIDNQVIWDYSININGDTTQIVLPFGRKFVLKDERREDDDVIYVSHDIQFLIVKNEFFYNISLAPEALHFDASAKKISIAKDVITGEELPDLSKGKMFVSLHFPSIYPRAFQLGTYPIEMLDENNRFYAYMDDNTANDIVNADTAVYVNFFFVPGLKSHDMYDTGNNEITVKADGTLNFMVIEKSDEELYLDPIPIENFMVFRKNNEHAGYQLLNHDNVLKMYYPNIYEIIDPEMAPGMTYKVYYFYHDLDDLKYHIMFDFYYKYLTDIFPDVSMEEIVNTIYFYEDGESGFPLFDNLTDMQKELFIERFKEIMSYEYFNYQYGESDFINRWSLIPGNEDKTALEYLHETLKTWVKDDPDILEQYVKRQKKLGTTYTLFTNTIDLTERERTDTSAEFPHSDRPFSELRYVFSLENSRNSGELLNARIFVDGICITDFYQRRKRYMDYFYIPASMVTDNSIIDIEVFPDYSFTENHVFNTIYSTYRVTLDTPKTPIWATISDIYMQDTTESEGEVKWDSPRIQHGLFDIIEHYPNSDILVKNDIDAEHKTEFTRLRDFTIKPNSEKVVGKDIAIVFNKIPHWYPFRYDGEEKARLYIEFDQYELNWNFALEYIRIFVNGRLLPRTHYIFQSTFSKPRIYFLDEFEHGSIIYIDITPYKYKEVYYQRELEEGQTLIDLTGYITKPFNIRYYDVFLNGRKLDIGNVFAITPWKITLVNIKSIYNLQIFERERDWEYFGLDFSQMRYPYTIDELINEEFMSDEEKYVILKRKIDELKDHRLTIVENTNEETEIIYDMSQIRALAQAYFFYYDELIPKTYVNPDVLQFDKVIMENSYDQIRKAFKMNSFDHPDTEKYPEVYLINPDEYFEGMNPSESEYTDIVYMMGHSNEVSEEMLNTPIVIDNDSPYGKEEFQEVVISFYEDNITTTDDNNVTIDSGSDPMTVTITDAGLYRLTGSSTNAKIIISDDVSGSVTIILDDLTIDNHSLPIRHNPIIHSGANTDNINLVANSTSVLTSAGVNEIGEELTGVVISSDTDGLTVNIYLTNEETSLTLVDGTSQSEYDYETATDGGIFIVGTVVFNGVIASDEFNPFEP